tara:strand:+ start:1806 stop:3962 length:2157 start_codon:yes stop_codon:yes gene_type:complete
MNYELQSTLARLLAKENITVTHGNMKTAMFDVKNRVLGLPMWKNKSKDVYDMLVGHEVGHALYTPEAGIDDFHKKCGGIPFDVCNIVEDIRIERMVQDTYPGLPRVFRKAYSELVEDDFFGTKEKNIPDCGFLDRLNLRGKVGSIIDIPLDADEELIYQKCLKAETFDDVLDICLEIKDMLEKEPPQDQSEPDDSSEENEESNPMPAEEDDSESEDTDTDGDDETDDGSEATGGDETDDGDEDAPEADSSSSDIESDSEEDDEPVNTDAIQNDGAGDGTSKQFKAETLSDFEEKLEDIVESLEDRTYTPVMLPRPNYIYDSIITYKMLRESRRESSFAALMEENHEYGARINDEFIAFRKTTKKKVGTLVREFEQRKAAYQYSRSTESRTGKLDVNKLHNYKLTDELFLSQSRLPNSKSHGMIFLLDYSGSMAGVLKDVIDQTLNLVTFCKKVGIPFRVYSFTNTWATRTNTTMKPTFNEVDLSDVILVEHITSEMSKTTYDEAFKDLWMTLNSHNGQSGKYDQLGGTPLDTVLTMMPTILTDFAKKNGIQKTTFVTLTDGESSNINTSHNYSEMRTQMQIKCSGKTHKISRYRSTNCLMEIISDLPGVSTIGFYLPNHKKELRRLLNRFTRSNEAAKKARKLHDKNGFSTVENRGFGAYYILDSDVGIDDGVFVTSIEEDAANSRKAQTKLAKQFGAHNQKARQTRVLLTSLAEQIA